MNSLLLLWINRISCCKYNKQLCWNDTFLLTQVIWCLYLCAPTGTHAQINLCLPVMAEIQPSSGIGECQCVASPFFWGHCYASVMLGLVLRWLITLCQFGEIQHKSVRLPKVPLGAVYVTLKSPNLGIKRFSEAYRAVGLQNPWSEMWDKLLLLLWMGEMNLL